MPMINVRALTYKGKPLEECSKMELIDGYTHLFNSLQSREYDEVLYKHRAQEVLTSKTGISIAAILGFLISIGFFEILRYLVYGRPAC